MEVDRQNAEHEQRLKNLNKADTDHRVTFRPPLSIGSWWAYPHCGLGSTDDEEQCPFCGQTRAECADQMTTFLKTSSDRMLYFYSSFDDQELSPVSIPCGGSGFRCDCGRFWANDYCGTLDLDEHLTADGHKMESRGGRTWCKCGKAMFYVPEKFAGCAR